MTSRHDLIQRLFLAACELEADRREAFLQQACGPDEELRGELDSLLEHHRPTTIFQEASEGTVEGKLARPQVSWNPPEAGDEPPPIRTSGTLIADRYRIVVQLGSGASGEVYRADDLTLGQSVALKFLRREKIEQESWLRRFREEVRLARTVTHRNVNRVYDLIETDADVFISMEYVDGEDLQTLLRRIGRIPHAKGVQIVSQICWGLLAAHKEGVLHRDLKPANIMLDGRGQVQITDFGIALPADAKAGQESLAGTPDYMAPELFEGRRATVQSDLYSLGVVIYELFTGRPFRESSFAGSAVAQKVVEDGLSSDLVKLIRWCVDADPEKRPASALVVVNLLSGGDPLATSTAAGEIPSPAMVASMTDLEQIQPRRLKIYFLLALCGLLACVPLAQPTFLLSKVELPKAPDQLCLVAQQIITQLRHDNNLLDQDYGFTIDRGFFDEMTPVPLEERDWKNLKTGQPPAMYFWYRQGDHRIRPPTWLGDSKQVEQLPLEPGMTSVQLDGHGRLKKFVTATLELDESVEGTTKDVDPNWSWLFEISGLEFDDFTKVERPSRAPAVYADTFKAWEGTYPGQATPIRVKAGAVQGKVVYFDVVETWEKDARQLQRSRSLAGSSVPAVVILTVLFYSTFLASLYRVWRYWGQNQADRRGALRLALCFFLLNFIRWTLRERHVSVFAEESSAVLQVMAVSTFKAFACWTYYMALEPVVRQCWPQTLVSWSCVLRGDWHNAVVGRDMLVGGMVGMGLVLFLQCDSLLPLLLGFPVPHPQLPMLGFDVGSMAGPYWLAATVIQSLSSSIIIGIVMAIVMIALRQWIQRPWILIGSFVAIMTVITTLGFLWDAYSPWLANLLMSLIFALLLRRCGLLTLIVCIFVSVLVVSTPMTIDPHDWRSGNTLFVLLFLGTSFSVALFSALTARPLADAQGST